MVWRESLFNFRRERTPQQRFEEIVSKLRKRFKIKRTEAFNDVKLHYPDARVLVSENGHQIIGFSENRKSVLYGVFHDEPRHDPTIRFATDSEITSYLDKFQSEIDQFDQDIRNGFFSFMSPYRQRFSSDLDELNFQKISRGYEYSSFDSRRLVSCDLLFDDNTIWSMGINSNGNKDSLRTAIEKRWYQSSEFSNKSSFEIEVRMVLMGYATSIEPIWKALFLGGEQLTGKSKALFSSQTIESIVEFVGKLPVWEGSEEEWMEYFEEIEFHDGINI
jgi:hypothetical protein